MENKVQIVASGPDVAGDSLYDALLTLIYKSEMRIWIATPYFIPDESLAGALQLASRRGIDVRILTPNKSNHFLADLARGSYVRQLEACGTKISLYPKMLHAKAFLIDDNYALIGSANFDMRSLLYNFEVGALVYSEKEIRTLREWFEKKFLESTGRLKPSTFFTDISEGIGRVLGPLI
jgi:cardiolipin synthase A/B